MEELLLDIVRALRENPSLDARGLSRLINAHSSRLPGDERFSKKQLVPFYLHVRQQDPDRWESWGIDARTERLLLRLIQVKPTRTASGVATVTVITRPAPCSGDCLFCPADVRMPKSYLAAEPACQRAERNWFDPYLQVSARLAVLSQMGHATDKVELIVLGGTFDDYPQGYRIWFVKELFRALNDAGAQGAGSSGDCRASRERRYRRAGIANEGEAIEAQVAGLQASVTAGDLPFGEAIARHYGPESPWAAVAGWQRAGLDELAAEQRRNETAAHRCVGLVVETRPDCATPGNLALLRRLGCTKVQVGVQTLDPRIARLNGRAIMPGDIARAFGLLRLFGFKIHAHFMVNLPGATPAGDAADYRRFATEAPFQPDEVKLYPCALIASAPLARRLDETGWRPYPEQELVDVLAADVLATPGFTRISRMIRDFSAEDVVAGNKKANLRQMVEAKLRAEEAPVREIRFREIRTDPVDMSALQMDDIAYPTPETREHFLQWTAPDGRIAGFLRLSLPRPEAVAALGSDAPVGAGEAMIREVHVYGRAARLDTGESAATAAVQHRGLGRALVERACAIAREAGYSRLNVISAVGTRAYYRRIGFSEAGLYQQRDLRMP